MVDGDTIDVRDDLRGRLRIRVLGIDTPETKKPGYTVGCYGPEASAFAEKMLRDSRISWSLDPSQDVHDRYGRTLAYVFLPDGTNYSVAAAAGGYAHSYVYKHHPSRYASEIAAAEIDAQAAGRGLWGPTCGGQTASVPSQGMR